MGTEYRKQILVREKSRNAKISCNNNYITNIAHKWIKGINLAFYAYGKMALPCAIKGRNVYKILALPVAQ